MDCQVLSCIAPRIYCVYMRVLYRCTNSVIHNSCSGNPVWRDTMKITEYPCGRIHNGFPQYFTKCKQINSYTSVCATMGSTKHELWLIGSPRGYISRMYTTRPTRIAWKVSTVHVVRGYNMCCIILPSNEELPLWKVITWLGMVLNRSYSVKNAKTLVLLNTFSPESLNIGIDNE